MSTSKTKQGILARHIANELLLAPALPVAPGHPKDLSVEQPTMPIDPAVADYVTPALYGGETHYVDVPGMAPLRQALAAAMQGAGLLSVEAANVLVSAGMQETRYLAIQILGELLGPVALPQVVHPGARKALGIRPLRATEPLPCDAAVGYLPTLAGIRKALAGGAKVLYLESPVRLSGAMFDAVAVAEIATLAREHGAAVIWDQGLAPWVKGYVSLWNEPGMDKQAVLIGEAFPGVGLESWFIGYVVTNAEWFDRFRRDK
ncbi:MAG: aminotransferase class I/II-fold pyridoxal phosphate-dependent enzyme, partial [Chloroflexi bacterium]|nr:aminotransferase class I/II-fold pyridoxal phosphate-dependent enzyme [Chloroflexota bacterium]